MSERSEVSAGGVVYRKGRGGWEVAIGEQRDRLSGARTVRLPKGKIDPGETPEQAALREVREETGLVARVVALLCDADYAYDEADARVAKRVHYFLLELVSGAPRPLDGELERVRWCPIDEAAAALSFETERDAVVRARRRLDAEPRP